MLHAELRVETGGERLRLLRTGGCPGCALAGGCSSAVVAAAAAPLTLPVPDACVGLREGQHIRAELAPPALLRLCAIVFLPLSALTVFGGWLAAQLWPATADPASACGAAAGLLVGCMMLKRYDSHFGRRWLRRRRWILPSGMDAQRVS